ncbi:MAG: DUF4268 domain-containing protein [Candidatus Omnitrophica bacterium]|nr:DUF4268 domain-containing protein [Candidatus Omnitrophota bacterium]
MLFTYSKNSKKISLYKETDLKSHNILERQDIEKWVENYPDILGEELLILSTEYDKFDKTDERLDLLAIDRNGNIVIVELKRDDSGKTVELQAIKYAAYCSNLTLEDVAELYRQYLEKKGVVCNIEEAGNKIVDFIENEDFEELSDKPRIILVSKEFRPEVASAVVWLRKFNVNIICVKLTPYSIDKDTIAFESNILIPVPEVEEIVVGAERKEINELTLTQQEYVKFYKDLSARLNAKIPRQYPKSLPQSWYQISTGVGGVHFEWAFHGRPRDSFEVGLHFEKGDKALNSEMMVSLEKFKSEIEQKTGEKVVFQKDWNRHWSRLYIEKQEGSMTEELKKWAVDKLEILYKILQPELNKIK